ncbi:MAG: lipoate--protein ligase family protein [Ancrocorticia sp.]|uniref:lipoate--protein ligase family protein n=1 Tax=Ancrocorticia sp. TaxID=2593684 RepID=UPI003F8EC1D4
MNYAATLPERFDLLTSKPLSVAFNLGLDHGVAASVAGGQRPAAVRIWNWAETCAVIGSSQSLSNEIDLEAASNRGVRVLRRSSGGGTMFMDPQNAITYSVILPTQALAGLSLRDSYALCDSWVLKALQGLGVPAFYRPINDIATDDGKIGGAAQRRMASGVTIHHATMSWDINGKDLLAVTRLFREDLRTRGTKSAQKKVVGISQYCDASRGDVIEAMVRSLEGGAQASDTEAACRRIRRGTYRPDELAEAKRMASSKFAARAWLHRID